MNLEARKIEFIQEFLKLQSEEAISRLEKFLHKERLNSKDSSFERLTIEELNTRIEKSEADFENNRFKSSSTLLDKFK